MEYYVNGVSRVALSSGGSGGQVGLIRGPCPVVPCGCFGGKATQLKRSTGSVRGVPGCGESVVWRLVRGREKLPAATVPGTASLLRGEVYAADHAVRAEIHPADNYLQPVGSIVRKGGDHAFDLQHHYEADGVGLSGGNYAVICECGVQSAAATSGCQRGRRGQ